MKSGGGLVVYQSLLSLNNISEVDYVGPEIKDDSISEMYNQKVILYPTENKLIRVIDLFFIKTSSFYRSWNKAKIDFEKYDYIFLEFTKFNFVIDTAAKRDKKIITRVHNVERDYSYNIYIKNKNISNRLKYYLSSTKEKKILEYATEIIVLTENDRNRIKSLYKVDDSKISIIPICLNDSNKNKDFMISKVTREERKRLKLLVTGSLWYGPNYDGVKWFVENVYDKLQESCDLIIAGANPNNDLLYITKKYKNITVFENPKDMKNIFNKADLYVAPIFYGAGMKVKVAEALSYGLPVVGTTHSFIGYEVTDNVNSFIADSDEQFYNSIEYYKNLSDICKKKLSQEAYMLYRDNYSINKSIYLIQNIFIKLLGENHEI